MKSIKIYRNNEFVGNANKLSVFINEEKFDLPTNSSIIVSCNDENVVVKSKYLWLKSQVSLNDKEEKFIIRIKPIVSNNTLVVSISTVVVLFVIQFYFPSSLSNFLFKIVGITFIALFFYISTFGGKYFYKIEVNQE